MSKLKIKFDSSFYGHDAKRLENQVVSFNDFLCLNFYTAFSRIYVVCGKTVDFNLDDDNETRRGQYNNILKGANISNDRMSIEALRNSLYKKGMKDWQEQTAIIAAILQTQGSCFFQLGSIFQGIFIEASNNHLTVPPKGAKISVDYNKSRDETTISYTVAVKNNKDETVGEAKAVVVIKNYLPTLTHCEITIDKNKAFNESEILKTNMRTADLSMASKEWRASTSAKLPKHQAKKSFGFSAFLTKLINALNNFSKKFTKDEIITLKPSIHKPVIKEQAKQDIKAIHEVASESKPTYSPVTQNKVEIAQQQDDALETVNTNTPRNRM
jgi:hypothetical protein